MEVALASTECEDPLNPNTIISMQHIIDKQASLEVQISEEIKKYTDELQRVAVSGGKYDLKDEHRLKKNLSNELSKTTLEENRENFVHDLLDGVPRTSFEPSVASDVLTHHVAVSGQKRNVRTSIESTFKRFIEYQLQEKFYMKTLIEDRMNTKKGYESYETTSINYIENLTEQYNRVTINENELREYKETFDVVHGKKEDIQKHLNTYLCWLMDEQNLSIRYSIFGKRLQCQDVGNRFDIYQKIIEISRQHSGKSGENNHHVRATSGNNSFPKLTVNAQHLWQMSLSYFEYFKDYVPVDLADKLLQIKGRRKSITDDQINEHVGHLVYEATRIFDEAYKAIQKKFVFRHHSGKHNEVDEQSESDEHSEQDDKENSQMSLDSSNWFNSKFQAYVFKALAGENDDVTNLFETEHNSPSLNSTFVEKPSATGLSNTIDKLLVVEQDFLKEKKIKLVKDRLEHEIDTYNVRTTVRKRNADIGTLQEDATAVFGRESNYDENTMNYDEDEDAQKGKIPLLSEHNVRRISESVRNRIKIVHNLRYLKTVSCRHRLLTSVNYLKCVEKRLSSDFSVDERLSKGEQVGINEYSSINDNAYMASTIFSDEKQEWHVRQPYSNFDKMYDSSLKVFKKIEHNILEIGSSYIRKFEGEKSKDDANLHVADRAEILAQLYDCEDEYYFRKASLINLLMSNVYLNLISIAERETLRNEILRIMYDRPNVYPSSHEEPSKSSTLNKASYFVDIYMNEVKVLKSKARLYKTIIDDQLELERKTRGTTTDIIGYDGAKFLVRLIPLIRHAETASLRLLLRCCETKYSSGSLMSMLYDLRYSMYQDVLLKEWNYVCNLHNDLRVTNSDNFHGIDSNINCVLSISNIPTFESIKHAIHSVIKTYEDGIFENSNSSKQAPPGIQTYYNAIESLMLREELILLYFESEFFREYYHGQREFFGRDIVYQDDRLADSGNYKPKALQSNKSPGTVSKKKIDSSKEQIKTNFQTYSFYPLALNDYKYSLYNESEADSYDYRTIRGITNIINLDEKGLKLLRIAVKSQALEQSLLLTAIRHNQLQIDEIQLISAKKNIGSFFITESEKSNYRSKLREMSSHIRQHFFSVYQRKEKHHEIFWASFALRSKQFKRESNDLLKKKLLRDLKLEMVEDLCVNIIQEIEVETLRYQAIVACEDLERVSRLIRFKGKEQFEDQIFYTNEDFIIDYPGLSAKQSELKLSGKKDSFILGNSHTLSVNNIWYIPNRDEFMNLWNQNASIDCGETKREKWKVLMSNALLLFTSLRDIFWLIKVRCHFFSTCEEAGSNDRDVLYDTMKYEWSKLKFYLEQRDTESNSSDSNFKPRRDMRNFSNILVDILRFRTYLFLVLKSAISEIHSKCANDIVVETGEVEGEKIGKFGVESGQKAEITSNINRPKKVSIIGSDGMEDGEALVNIKRNKRVYESVQIFSEVMMDLLGTTVGSRNAYDAHNDFVVTNNRNLKKSAKILLMKDNMHSEPLSHKDNSNYGGGGGSRWFWSHLYKVTYTSNALAIACLEETKPLLGPGYCAGSFTGYICNSIQENLKCIVSHTYSARGPVRNYANGMLLSIEYLLESHIDDTCQDFEAKSGAKNKISSIKSKVRFLTNLEKRRNLGNAILRLNQKILKWKYIDLVQDHLNTLTIDQLKGLLNNCLTMKQIMNIQLLHKSLELMEYEGKSYDSNVPASNGRVLGVSKIESTKNPTDLQIHHLKCTIQQLQTYLKNKTQQYHESISSEQRNVNGRVASRCYALLFGIDALRRKNQSLEEAMRHREAELIVKARSQCLNEIEALKMENIRLKGRFEEYKETMKLDMLGELSMANRMALSKILDNDTVVTNKLKQRTVKIAKAEEDVVDLKRDLSSSKREVAIIRTEMEEKLLQASLENERKLNAATEKLNKSETLWSKVTEMEKREEDLKEELISAQSTTIEKNSIIEKLRRDLKLSEHTKNELLHWKITQTQVLTHLRNEIQQYKETNNLYQSPKKSKSDVDIAALKNLLKSSKSSLHRANQAVVQLKRELDREKKLKRKAFQQIAIMKEKESRNNNAKEFDDRQVQNNNKRDQHIDHLADDYNDLSENYRLLYVQNEQLRALLRDNNISPPTEYAGPPGLSERKDWKFVASKHGKTGVDLTELANKNLKYTDMDLQPWDNRYGSSEAPPAQLGEPQNEHRNLSQTARPQTAPTGLMDNGGVGIKLLSKKRGRKKRVRPKSASRFRQKFSSSLPNRSKSGNSYGSRMPSGGNNNIKLKIDSSHNMHNFSTRKITKNGVAPVSPLSKRKTVVMQRLIDEGRKKNASRMRSKK